MSEKTEIQKTVKTDGQLQKSTLDFGVDVHSLNETNQSYLDKYAFQGVFDGNEIVIRSASDIEQEIYRGKSIKAVVLYSHSVWTLRNEDDKTVCKTYDFPRSKGSFKGSFESYLKSAELRKQLYKRNYYFVMLPELSEAGKIPKGTIVPVTCGSSSFKSFNKLVNDLSQARAVLLNTVIEISTVKDKTPSNDSYNRPVFKSCVDSVGAPLPVVTEKPHFEALLRLRAGLKKNHDDIVILSESLDPMVESEGDDNNGEGVPMGAVINDSEIPF